MKRPLLLIPFLLLSFKPIYGGVIESHNLRVVIDPERHTIEGRDEIHIREGVESVSLSINRNLDLLSVKGNGRKIPYRVSVKGERRIISIPEGVRRLSLSYRGAIYYKIRREKKLTFLRGDVTRGIISEEGVFLSPESGWYPDDGDSLATFHLTVEIKGGLNVVTQGESIRRKEEAGREYSEWRVDIPSDGLVLVASRYVIERKRIGGITYATYLSRKNAHLSKLFIEASKRYIDFYSGIIGRYPFKEWAVVENFFSSGYGMPGFTLLDPMVVRMGKRILRPGYIDHEIVHSWFGNFVYPDYKRGNWAEALTTYLANYYYKEALLGEDEARRHRIITVERYSIRVSPERGYPLRRFITKEEEFENDIGYGKGSMVFHYLRRIVGDETFFKAIRTFVERYGGRQASWDEIEKVFEEAYRGDLSWFFRQWLDRSRGPRLRLEDVRIEKRKEGYTVRGVIRQIGELYRLPLVPLVISTEKGREEFSVDLEGEVSPFSFTVKEEPLLIEVDPDYHIFRIVAGDDLNPSLNLLLSREEKYYVIAGKGEEYIRPLFERLKEKKGGRITDTSEVEKILKKGSILLAGTDAIIPNPWLTTGKGGFTFMGRNYERPDQAILLTIKNPYRRGEVITIYHGNSPEALSKARYIPYYGNDTYIIFEGGRPIERGFIKKREGDTRYDLQGISRRRIENHIRLLASVEMKGRLPGSTEDERVRRYLKEELLSYGLKVYKQDFVVKDAPRRRLKAAVNFQVRTGNVIGVREKGVEGVINMDTVGRGRRKVYIMGRSIYPALAERVRKYIPQVGLMEGKDIDRFAYREGSDRYAFHEAGMPAIDIFSSDYRSMDQPGDSPDTIGFEKVRRIGEVIYRAALELSSEE